jgi:hypothetical protein
MFLSEIDTLRRLRKHRADRAERALREAKRLQRSLLAQVEDAQQALDQTRLLEAQRSEELLGKHQGQVISFQQLKSWNTQEGTLSAGTRRKEGELHELQGQRGEHDDHVYGAQKQATQYLREVEKLQELCILLAQEDTQEQI